MRSEVKAPLIQAPIAWVARRLLACDRSVAAVMILARDGKILAHERALEYEEIDSLGGESYPLLFYARGQGLIFYVSLDEKLTGEEIPNRILATIESPSFAMTR